MFATALRAPPGNTMRVLQQWHEQDWRELQEGAEIKGEWRDVPCEEDGS